MKADVTFGRWLKRRRAWLGFTQKELAEKVGYAEVTLRKVEADELRPSRWMAERLAEALQVAAEERPQFVQFARDELGGDEANFPATHRLTMQPAHPANPFQEQERERLARENAAKAKSDAPEQPLDPFVVGRPVAHPRQFFGRQQEVRRIFGLWKQHPLQHVAIVGPRRSGKTSLAYYLMNLAKTAPAQLRPAQQQQRLPNADHYRWLYINFQDPRTHRPDWLFRYILTQLALPVPEPCDLFQFVDLIIEQQKQPSVILMDEIGAALTASALDMEFWWGMRSLGTDAKGKLAFLLTSHGLPEQQAQDLGKPSPFFNIFHTLHLGPLREDEAKELVNSSPIAFATADIEWILTQSQWWPSLLQILCHARLVTLEEKQDDESWKEEGLRQIAPHSHLLKPK